MNASPLPKYSDTLKAPRLRASGPVRPAGQPISPPQIVGTAAIFSGPKFLSLADAMSKNLAQAHTAAPGGIRKGPVEQVTTARARAVHIDSADDSKAPPIRVHLARGIEKRPPSYAKEPESFTREDQQTSKMTFSSTFQTAPLANGDDSNFRYYSMPEQQHIGTGRKMGEIRFKPHRRGPRTSFNLEKYIMSKKPPRPFSEDVSTEIPTEDSHPRDPNQNVQVRKILPKYSGVSLPPRPQNTTGQLPPLRDWSSKWTSARPVVQRLDRPRSNSTRDDARPRAQQYGIDLDDELQEMARERRLERKKAPSTSNEERFDGLFDDEDEARLRRKEARKREKKEKAAEKAAKKTQSLPQITLPHFISVSNLAAGLKMEIRVFLRKLTADLGFETMGSDHVIDAETAGLIAREFHYEPIMPQMERVDNIVALPIPEDKSTLSQRPPVITIMGHVDHGKTTLLDWLRKSSVAASEHGGITQHIGAFTVEMPSGRSITFLDTPGHAAFLDMRARGAQVTDIVILVVAADDSVKPQTIEAIKHAKSSHVPIIVAINKMDKPDADAQRVKQDLAQHGITVEDFGGDTQTVNVSGKTGLGMADLEEAAVAQADVMDLRADASGQIEGWVLEAASTNAGKVATVLVRRGTLTAGTILVAGDAWGRVRALRNEAGVHIDSAPPGTPVEVDGWRELPAAGAEVLQAPDEQRARRVVEMRVTRAEAQQMGKDVAVFNETRVELEERRVKERRAEELRIEEYKRKHPERRHRTIHHLPAAPAAAEAEPAESGPQTVPFVVRADVAGSVEAVRAALLGLGNAEVQAAVPRALAGPLAPSDVEHAAVVGASLVTFNAAPSPEVLWLAERNGVRIIEGSIIYRVVDEAKELLEERLPPLISTRVLGEAEIAQIFEIRVKARESIRIAGCKVRNGVVSRGAKVKVLRDGNTVHDGEFLHTISHGAFPPHPSALFPTLSRVKNGTYEYLKARSPLSKIIRRTSMRCAKAPIVASALKVSTISEWATRFNVTKSSKKSVDLHRGLCKIPTCTDLDASALLTVRSGSIELSESRFDSVRVI